MTPPRSLYALRFHSPTGDGVLWAGGWIEYDDGPHEQGYRSLADKPWTPHADPRYTFDVLEYRLVEVPREK